MRPRLGLNSDAAPQRSQLSDKNKAGKSAGPVYPVPIPVN